MAVDDRDPTGLRAPGAREDERYEARQAAEEAEASSARGAEPDDDEEDDFRGWALDEPTVPPGKPALVSIAPAQRVISALPPEHLEQFIIGGIHQDRSPGNVLVVLHPGKVPKLPLGLFEALNERGFRVHILETQADQMASVRAIRDELRRLATSRRPLDVIVVGGDGTLDHHFLLGAFAAFYPYRVRERTGRLRFVPLTDEEIEAIPQHLRLAFELDRPLRPIPPTEENVRRVWILRAKIEDLIRKGKSVPRILRRAKRPVGDPLLRIAVLATLYPDKVVLRPPHFDLTALAEAPQSETFRGLYPWIRCLVPYPAGTAADNAVFAGVPGLIFGLLSKALLRSGIFRPLLGPWSRRTTRRFVQYFCEAGTIVPARISLNKIDGRWQRIGSHAAGGPTSGHFFSEDLVKKPKTLLGYLAKIPSVIVREGVFGSTMVRLQPIDAWGRPMPVTETAISEGLFTNRTFMGGIGSLPTTTPASFGGESSLVAIPPIVGRSSDGQRTFDLRGLGAFFEAIGKGLLARAGHLLGIDPGRLAGEGELSTLPPAFQVALKEGAEVRIQYTDRSGRARAVPIQISGDPFQAHSLDIRVFWGPIPLLAARGSLLLNSTRRTLTHLRMQHSYGLRMAYIGGVHYFRHETGPLKREQIEARTGLVAPPFYLPEDLELIRRMLTSSWQRLETGEFVDTSEPGRKLRKKGVFAHNNDQSAHLLLMREGRDALLVRQVRRLGRSGAIFEAKTRYREEWGAYVIAESQIFHWPHRNRPGRILQEERFFRDAAEFQMEAPSYFPVLGRQDDGELVAPPWEELAPGADPEQATELPTDLGTGHGTGHGPPTA